MRVEEEIRYWVDLARYDLGVAGSLLKARKYVYALFFGHLVIEKMLKAAFVKRHGTSPPPTHNLVRLANDTSVELSEEDREFLRGLMEFNIEARYPRDAQKIRKICTKRFAEEMLKRVRKWHRRLSAEIRS